MKEKIKDLADHNEIEMALTLARSQELAEQDIAYSCGAILDKIPSMDTYKVQLDKLAELEEKYPKTYQRMLNNLK